MPPASNIKARCRRKIHLLKVLEEAFKDFPARTGSLNATTPLS